MEDSDSIFEPPPEPSAESSLGSSGDLNNQMRIQMGMAKSRMMPLRVRGKED